MWVGLIAGTATHAQTAAGTSISDSASATYVDPNNSGTTVNATSNTVTVTVAEVAGMTLTGAGVTNHTTGGSNNLPGNTLYYDYTITNTGNDPTDFVIPGTATLTGPITLVSVSYSTDGGTTYTTVSGTSATTSSIAEAGTVKVRVIVTVNSSASPGNTMSVLVGNVNPNDNSSGTQNQAYPAAPTNGTGKCYTQDCADGSVAGEVSGAPTNGEREASATESATAGSMPTAFAQLSLTHGSVTSGVDSQHDTIPYDLSFTVNSSAPTGTLPEYVAADLEPTSISVDSSSVSKILVSMAIPVDTVLNATPSAPAGWTVVYTTTATSTDADSASWTSSAPSPLSNTTRVGFINAGPVTKGTTVTGFSLTVLTSGVSLTASTQVAGIAQLFGLSNGDTTNALCYDESGDADPANFNDDGSYFSDTPTTGVANPSSDGTDASNNNTGTGSGGEDNVYTVLPAGTIGYGPNGQPTATGPTDGNDDYTNLATAVASGIAPGSTINPSAVSFTNTLKNTGSTTISSTVYAYPVPPTVLTGGANTDLPNGTTVQLSYGGNTPLYTYNSTGGTWSLTSGTPVSVSSFASGATVSITASVQLPNGTALSTDTGKGYPVVLRAYIDRNGNSTYDSGETYDDTVDRVYTGFLEVTTQERILDTDGSTVVQDYGTSLTTSNMTPGRYLEYKVTYTNISSTGGTNCSTLSGHSIVITDSGVSGGDNWGVDNDGNGVIDTSNVVGTAIDSGGGTITYFSGTAGNVAATDQTGSTAAADVTKYVDTLAGDVAAGASGTFTFKRKLN